MNLSEYIITFSVIVVIVTFLLFWFYELNRETLPKNINYVEYTVDGYTIVEFPNALSHEECDHIISLAETTGYEKSMVYEAEKHGETGKVESLNEEYRSGETCWLKNKDDEVVNKIAKLSEYVTKIPIDNQEALQVAKYNKNDFFKSHYDCCLMESSKDNCIAMNRNAGQRRSTYMVYLNDDFEGGETEFEKIGIKVKPEKGKAILFWTTNDDESLIENSMHAGNSVTKGNKYICTKWSHSLPWTDE